MTACSLYTRLYLSDETTVTQQNEYPATSGRHLNDQKPPTLI